VPDGARVSRSRDRHPVHGHGRDRESPILGSLDAERIYDPIIDYLQKRSDLDGSRIGVMGMSFGGYWVTKIAHLKRERLQAAVCWGAAPLHFPA